MAVDEQNYHTPDGYVDLPSHYVYDTSMLTDGQTYQNLVRTIEYDSTFILRAILNVPSSVNPAGGGFRLSNFSKSRVISNFQQGYSKQVAIAPEIIYPPNSQILFDLQNVLRSFNAQGGGANVYTSQVVFQGVKRYKPGVAGYSGPAFPTPYDPAHFIERPWTYVLPVTLNWNSLALPRTFTVEVQDWDFELHAIAVLNTATGAPPTFDMCALSLYDQSAKRALSQLPVVQSAVNNLARGHGNPVFPVPPQLYPVWTQIRLDISSLLTTTDPGAPYSLQIAFLGVNRTPRVANILGAHSNDLAAPLVNQWGNDQ